MRGFNIQGVIADPSDPNRAIHDLNQVSDKVRLLLKERRTFLARLRPATSPNEGELLFDGEGVYLAVGGEYHKLATVVEVEDDSYLAARLKRVKDDLELLGIPKDQWGYYGGL